MAKYIDADTVVSMPFLDDSYGIEKHTMETDTIENLLDRFTKEGCPEPADVVQVVHAHWIQTSAEDDNGNAYYSCSNCGRGESHNPIVEVPYCWKCGAKMDAHGEE